MRIETWNMKSGDHIQVFGNNGCVYIGIATTDPWEEDNLLLVYFSVRRHAWTNTTNNNRWKGIALFHDIHNKWFLVHGLSEDIDSL